MDSASSSYTYLGPSGTFTEAALLQVPGAERARRVPSSSAEMALSMIRSGEVDAAMLPIENSIEGGVSATLDAIATGQELRIIREAIVPVSFVLAAPAGVQRESVSRVGTHPHAWAQTRGWLEKNIPQAEYVPATSTAAAAHELLSETPAYQAAICAKLVAEQLGLNILAEAIEDNAGAVTRFVLIARPGVLPAPTGSDKTTVAIPLPEDRPGALMEILDQFATRGVNLSRIESRPTGQFLGHYFFSIDAEGHLADARMADALGALHRISPHLRFMGSYPRADAQYPLIPEHTTDRAFESAQRWLAELRGAQPE
ncbi:prephenate dehydratase [Psychromicrobium silvestre]|uniref:Prephenate dehydratase n=1 Tax=Psychromicrobium silvestre TaxID=1645614 RepID=A0A7Y9LV08_9MICC|nr:prephenate dehydratase [Psychromicrobium silvestre]NYE96045.1 prephenate dehydratase [Psychromicrobium silvestre]